MNEPQRISARDNPLLQRIRKLQRDSAGYRRAGQVWLEGEHLCAALQSHGLPAVQALLSDDGWRDPALRRLSAHAARTAVVSDALFAGVSGLESPGRIGMLIDLPPATVPLAGVASVVLDRVQDAGNVGSILRSAAAFGVRQVLALQGTAALWSPKVLRAGMGAHFALRLVEQLDADAVLALELPMVATSSHAPTPLHHAALPAPCAWILGHEGQGVSSGLLQACALQVRVPQPGGEESLNVAAAAAVCLWESVRRGLDPR